MIGWAILLVLALAAAAMIRFVGFARSLWPFAIAAILLAAAGYTLQGRPGQPGAPRVAEAQRGDVAPGAIELRHAMFGRFDFADSYLIAADAMTRAGSKRSAVRVLLGGIAKSPRNVALWTGLGVALSDHDGGAVSPPARFAFDQAMRLAPRHPGPPFFLGLAYIRAEDYDAARRYWARALALTPEGASYRDEIATRLALLDRLLAMPGGMPR